MTWRGRPFLRHIPSRAVAVVVLASLAGAAMAEAHLGDADPFQSAVRAVQAKDFAAATSLFETLAEADDYDAQFNLAILLRAGQGRPQNFVQALEWSLLAQLGGVERAVKLSADLSELVTPDAQADVFERIDLRLRERLAHGDRSAIMQFIELNSTTLPEPDMQTAYVWSLIAAALGLEEAAAKRDALMAELEADVILTLQDEARALFEDQEMMTLFAAQASGGL
ncbi:MAG: SEL1-like repeat protein [Shimia sp.]|uniref:SEL1-like repeat protein n=1 Tax=Shimia sp. TaxID=1954381 RepID=UPI001B172A36|nr:SEL1-like repeat protein [Shimia sp.]MBO6898124.1 SEL1-like repeat protein [Shimia sp.]